MKRNRNKKAKRLASVLLSACVTITMLLTTLPFITEPVYAIYGPVEYIDENGEPQTCTSYYSIDAPRWNHQLYGWNVIDGEVFMRDDRQEVDEDAHIIITDGSSLTIKKGLTVKPGCTLYIYGQSGGTGKLIVNENKKDKYAGIGGGNNEGCGTIVINGCKVTAYGGSGAAGIGGGNNGSCGTVIINGGTVTACGGSDAAGIGSGNEPGDGNVNGTITINGGKVNAYGGKYGAGIGGGDLADGGTITINGGKVYAEGGQEAAAIGGGDGDGTKYGNGGTITINGGNVTAESFEHTENIDEQLQDKCLGAGIGGGTEGGAGTITITGGVVHATGHRGGAGIGSGCDVNQKSDKSLIGGTIKISGGEVHGYTPEPDNPDIRAYGGGAGIGSGRNSPGCDITISGGTVYGSGSNYQYLKGGDGGAGIGNSQHSSGGSIKIIGGTIEAYSPCATPIGQGANGSAPACTLDYPECKVWWLYWNMNESTTIISSENDRSSDAFTKAGNDYKIHIEPCDHPNIEYQSNETSHSTHCDNCGKDILENHSWKLVNKGKQHQEVCKVCGYKGQLYDHAFDQTGDKCVCGAQGIRIQFESNGGSGDMPDEIIRKGDSYYLPECGFTPPDDKQFLGWKVSCYDSGSVFPPGHGVFEPQEPLTLTAQWGDKWHSLQVMIDEARNGDTIVLTNDFTAGPDDVEYLVASGKDITIDLNGHTIDRAVNTSVEAKDKGSVFRVEGNLTITDSSEAKNGVIKGGYPVLTDGSTLLDVGGAFMVDGGKLTIQAGTVKESMGTAGAVCLVNGATFNLEGGTITDTNGLSATVVITGGSRFNMSGGSITGNDVGYFEVEGMHLGTAAVYVQNGSFSMSGGSIIDNSGRTGRIIGQSSMEIVFAKGVVIDENGSFSVSGSPVIQGNGYLDVSDKTILNVWLAAGQTINVSGALGRGAKIGVSVEDEPAAGETRLITSGLPGNGSCRAFVSDNENHMVRLNADKEAILGEVVEIDVESVKVDPNEVTLVEGDEIDLTAIIEPEDAPEQTLSWSSNDDGVATVDQTTGKVTAVSEGDAIITVHLADSDITATCAVTVVPHEHEWKDATCTEPKTCTVCGQTEGEPAGHEWKDATCTEPKTCSKCGLTEGEAAGHDWGEPTYTWAEDNSSVTAERVCTRDSSHIEKETVSTTSEVTKPATCTEKGQTTYTTEPFENEAFTEQTKRVDNIDVLGHDYQDVEGTAKAATCTDPGKKANKKCTLCEDEIEGEEIEALGHKWGDWQVTKEATTTEEGEKQRVCENDPSHIEKETIPVLEPDPEPEPEPAPAPASTGGVLLAKLVAKGSNSIEISWTKISGVDGYDIFFSHCGSTETKQTPKKVKTVNGNSTFKWTKKGLKKKAAYKAVVKAYVMKDGKKTYVKTSPLVHVYTSGGTKNYTNPKSVTVKKNSVSLKKGKTFKIKATVKKLKKGKKLPPTSHAAKLRYKSSNTKVATVNKKGKITAKGKGTCYIYVYAANGVYKKVKVTVH